MGNLRLPSCLGICLALGCGGRTLDPAGTGALADSGAPYEHPRQPSLSAAAPNYRYYEGTSGRNQCARDQDCIISGCNGSTCAAEAIEISDEAFCSNLTMAQVHEPAYSECGCLGGECRWYSETDYDRTCSADRDCRGLGAPPGDSYGKALWSCVRGRCQWGM